MNLAEREGPPWLSSLGIVLGAHVVAVVGVLYWHARAPQLIDDAPLEAMMVELAAEPEAPPAPPTELPPGPPQQEQRRPEPRPAPKPESIPEPKPEVQAPPHEDPEVQDPFQQAEPEEQAPSDEANVERTTAPPSVSATSSERYAAQHTTSGAAGQAMVTWQGRLLGHLEQYRRYPRQAERNRREGVSYVRFSVDRKGKVSNPRIGRSSGHALLDEETLQTVRRASPVPPPPPEIKGDPVEVMVPVEFFIRRR